MPDPEGSEQERCPTCASVDRDERLEVTEREHAIPLGNPAAKLISCPDPFHQPVSQPPEGEGIELAEGQCWICGDFHPKLAPHRPGEVHRLTRLLASERARTEEAERERDRLKRDNEGMTDLLYHGEHAVVPQLEAAEAESARLREALENEWLMNHEERCSTTDRCKSFGGERTCYHPRPSAL